MTLADKADWDEIVFQDKDGAVCDPPLEILKGLEAMGHTLVPHESINGAWTVLRGRRES
jgi:hypothetical protein